MNLFIELHSKLLFHQHILGTVTTKWLDSYIVVVVTIFNKQQYSDNTVVRPSSHGAADSLKRYLQSICWECHLLKKAMWLIPAIFLLFISDTFCDVAVWIYDNCEKSNSNNSLAFRISKFFLVMTQCHGSMATMHQKSMGKWIPDWKKACSLILCSNLFQKFFHQWQYIQYRLMCSF